MGGFVTVQSKVGVGSKFIISLELEALDKSIIQKDSDHSFKNNEDIYSKNIIQNFK